MKKLRNSLGLLTIFVLGFGLPLILLLVFAPKNWIFWGWTTDQRLSATQIVVEMGGFAILIRQIVKERRSADLLLSISPAEEYTGAQFVSNGKELTAHPPPQGGYKAYYFDFLLINEGSASAHNFTIDWNFPKSIFDYGHRSRILHYPLEHPIKIVEKNTDFTVRFVSRDDVFVPPNEELRIGPFSFQVGSDDPGSAEQIRDTIHAKVTMLDGTKKAFKFMVHINQ